MKTTSTRLRQFGAMTLAMGVGGGWASSAQGFSEDICVPKDGGAVQECAVLPAACLPVGTTSNDCLAAALVEFLAVPGKTGFMRSLVHSDITHLLAQAAGFSADDAYWIAAYDEVPDYGIFEPFDLNGMPVGNGTLRTAQLDGLVRTNIPTGGALFHYVAPRSSPSPIDGLHPQVGNAEIEGLLAHLRTWAMAGSGNSHPLCTGGLTVASDAGDLATGNPCYPAADASVPLRGSFAILGPTAVPFSITTGPQTLVPSSSPPLFSDAFDSLVGGEGGDPTRIANARLGIYLHVLGDRVSHHVCSDKSALSGPTGPESAFRLDMTDPECAQGPHALRHIWEQAVDFNQLTPENKTTNAIVGDVYEELVVFAKRRGVANPQADDGSRKTALYAAILSVMQKTGADVRIRALGALACSYGYAPFPGAPACANVSDAGVDAGVDAGTGGGSPGNSGCAVTTGAHTAVAGFLAGVAMLAALFRRKRR